MVLRQMPDDVRRGFICPVAEMKRKAGLCERAGEIEVGRSRIKRIATEHGQMADPAGCHLAGERLQSRHAGGKDVLHRREEKGAADVPQFQINSEKQEVKFDRLPPSGRENAPAAMRHQILRHRLDPALAGFAQRSG